MRTTLRGLGVAVDIRPDYTYRGVRSYRVSTHKIERVLGFKPVVSVEDAVHDLVDQIRQRQLENLTDPQYDNLRWLRVLEEAQTILGAGRSIFDAPEDTAARLMVASGRRGPR